MRNRNGWSVVFWAAFILVLGSVGNSWAALAEVEGFRSARFGMTENQVLKAIYRDFKVPRSKVEHRDHPTEKTASLEIQVNNLFPESGRARVFYIFGYKSKKLIQVNVLWGKPVTPKPNPQQVVDTANQLRKYFARQNFQREGMVMNGQLKDGSILVFRGKDKKGRMVILHLISPKTKTKGSNKNIMLRLSYIESPSAPDIFQIGKGKF